MHVINDWETIWVILLISLDNYSTTHLIPFPWYHLIANFFVSMVLRNTDINNDYTDDLPGKVQTYYSNKKGRSLFYTDLLY